MFMIKPNSYQLPVLKEQEEFFEDIFKDFLGTNQSSFSGFKTDIYETETHFLLSVDLPGVKQDDIEIEVKDKRLSVKAKRQSVFQNSSGRRLSREKHYGEFSRNFNLPEKIDQAKIEAQLKDGVLSLSLPKKEGESVQKIAIKSEHEKEGLFSKILGTKSSSETK